MRMMVLHGEMEHDYIVCPITPELETALPALNEKVQQWADAEIEVVDEDQPEEVYLTLATAEEGLSAIEAWVDATDPDGE